MLLDFFATFFSSATALLPIFAQDILQRRRARLRLAVRGAGGRRAASPARHGAARSIASSAAGGCCCGRSRCTALATVVFGFSRSFWLTFALPGADRGGRHGQHGAPQHRPPARDARPPARADGRREHGVLHGRAAARRAGGRAGRELAGRAVSRWSAAGSACLVATGWMAAATPALRSYTRHAPARTEPRGPARG